MRLSFHGAAGGVTGSCHLIECNGAKVLIDCGMFQGSREIEEDNADPFGFEASSIDVLLLTHAHLDHCGRIPLLYKRGFRGEIITTAPSRDLARVVMMDAARLQEEDAERVARHARHAKHSHAHDQTIEPLYSTLDTLNAFDRFGRTASYGVQIEVVPGVTALFGNAGHILGSAWIRVELQEQGAHHSVLFSGDLGSSGRPLLNDPDPAPATENLVIETTYGDRDHKSLEASVTELYAAVNDAVRHGGNAVIPTFALDRAQEILFYLHLGERSGQLPRGLPVYLDSPMAITATEIYDSYPDYFNPQVHHLFEHHKDPLRPSGLRLLRDAQASAALNHVSGAVIMAGSGMCTGGRIRHHLRHNIGNPKASIIFVGYAADGTLARHIVEGDHHVRIFGDDLQVLARVYTINGFSAHADRSELLRWQATAQPATTFLVHGEDKGMAAMQAALTGKHVVIPKLNDGFTL